MRLRRAVKIQRALLFERVGSTRYSSPALNNLDQRLLSYLPKGPGVFLEIGANDGYSQSNTYFLERWCGWRGVLIEPLPSLYEVCRRIRKGSVCFNVACVADGGPHDVVLMDLDLMSVSLGLQNAQEEHDRLKDRRGRRVRVPARTLSSVLDEAGESEVDLMSVDVEGAELQVLSGLDLERHTPGHLLVETQHPQEVARVLGDRMHLVTQLSHHDYLFARGSF